jgi:toxin ParE1/3/4
LPKFSVSKAAQSDLRAIARYTLRTWGHPQALKYARELDECFQLLAENAGIGRECDAISSGLRRHELGKHVVFYRLKPGGIGIVRVLHQQMIPAKARFEP